jgi:ligand-binding sensor domain-containing protein
MLCLYGNAQINISRHHFNSLTIKDGMSEGTVAGLCQDKQCFIWIGTFKGLVRYDGYKSKVSDNGNGIPQNIVDKIFNHSSQQNQQAAEQD